METSTDPPSEASWLDIPDSEYLSKLEASSKYKERSHQTYHNIHLPELNIRLNLNLPAPSQPPSEDVNASFASRPNLSNTSKIEVVYLGNSMLERLKTTGQATRLGKLGQKGVAWNAGCGGDKNENVAYRLGSGMYNLLKQNPNIKLWILASGTNNLHAKRPFRAPDLQSWRVLLESCLRIAPQSKVLACDMFYRKDVPDRIVDECNEMLKSVVEEVNREMVGAGREEGVVWVEAREKMGKEMLVDHVHLDEEGYRVWDELLWPYVNAAILSASVEPVEK